MIIPFRHPLPDLLWLANWRPDSVVFCAVACHNEVKILVEQIMAMAMPYRPFMLQSDHDKVSWTTLYGTVCILTHGELRQMLNQTTENVNITIVQPFPGGGRPLVGRAVGMARPVPREALIILAVQSIPQTVSTPLIQLVHSCGIMNCIQQRKRVS